MCSGKSWCCNIIARVERNQHDLSILCSSPNSCSVTMYMLKQRKGATTIHPLFIPQFLFSNHVSVETEERYHNNPSGTKCRSHRGPLEQSIQFSALIHYFIIPFSPDHSSLYEQSLIKKPPLTQSLTLCTLRSVLRTVSPRTEHNQIVTVIYEEEFLSSHVM